MAPDRARDERKERQWRCWIDQWRASGLSVPAFCARRGLATPSFYHWRRVLERRAAEKAAFVPVQVLAEAVPAQASALEVVLAGGWTVRVAGDPQGVRFGPGQTRPGMWSPSQRGWGRMLKAASSWGPDGGAGGCRESGRWVPVGQSRDYHPSGQRRG